MPNKASLFADERKVARCVHAVQKLPCGDPVGPRDTVGQGGAGDSVGVREGPRDGVIERGAGYGDRKEGGS